MCLIALALNAHDDWPVVIVANRDEFFDRPTQAAAWWQDPPYAFGGRDLRAGGAWMAITRDARFAAVTNIRSGISEAVGASRGHIVLAALVKNSRVEELLPNTSPCNLIYGKLWPTPKLIFSRVEKTNSENGTQALSTNAVDSVNKIHTLSNGALNSPWPKAETLKYQLTEILATSASESSLENACFSALTNSEIPPDCQLPQTGVPLEWERVLSSAFITAPMAIGKEYGTRSSTVVLVNKTGQVSFCERTWDLKKREHYAERRTQFQSHTD